MCGPNPPLYPSLTLSRYLLAENNFTQITTYEERPKPGGVWLSTPNLPPKEKRGPPEQPTNRPPFLSPLWPEKSYTIPQPRPKHEPEPIYLKDQLWMTESPIYDDLTTNLPKQLMKFTDLALPDKAPLMPSHHVVQSYLEEYSKEVVEKDLVNLGSRVTSVLPMRDEQGNRTWEVTHTSVLDTAHTSTSTFDAVVVANGHYTSPFIPSLPGLSSWSSITTPSGSPLIIHSKSWRHPPLTPKKVLIVGAGISGMDIADHIAKSGSQVLLASRTFKPGGTMEPMVTHGNITYVHPVAELLGEGKEGRSVKLKDGSVEGNIDQVIFATGYFYDFPFFTKETESTLGLTVGPDSRTGPVNAVLGLWQHLIPRDEPTLSFLGLPSRIVPFPVVEVQSAFVARLLSGRIFLPSKDDMMEWESDTIFSKLKDGNTGLKYDIKDLIEEVADGDKEEISRRARRYVNGDFHTLHGTDGAYINVISDLCSAADRKTETREGRKVGKQAPYWDEKTMWTRRMVPIIQKVMREGRKESTRELKEVEEVVGTFEHWKVVEKAGQEVVEREKKRIFEEFGCGEEAKEKGEDPEEQVGY